MNRLKKIKVDISYGSNWVSLNKNSIETIIKNKDFIAKVFKNSYLGDELAIHTTLKTFNCFDNLYHYDSTDDFQGNLRYINWWDGGPYTWTTSEKDIEQLKYGKAQGHLFSRKFALDAYSEMKEKILEIINSK